MSPGERTRIIVALGVVNVFLVGLALALTAASPETPHGEVAGVTAAPSPSGGVPIASPAGSVSPFPTAPPAASLPTESVAPETTPPPLESLSPSRPPSAQSRGPSAAPGAPGPSAAPGTTPPPGPPGPSAPARSPSPVAVPTPPATGGGGIGGISGPPPTPPPSGRSGPSPTPRVTATIPPTSGSLAARPLPPCPEDVTLPPGRAKTEPPDPRPCEGERVGWRTPTPSPPGTSRHHAGAEGEASHPRPGASAEPRAGLVGVILGLPSLAAVGAVGLRRLWRPARRGRDDAREPEPM